MKTLVFLMLMAAPPEISSDVEARARDLGQTLRCVVCQNQSIEESDAELAEDMRNLVRERLAAGDTEAEVTALMRDRYGDFVLLKPPVQRNTYVLWFAPVLFVIGALGWFVMARREPQMSEEKLSKVELETLARMRDKLD